MAERLGDDAEVLPAYARSGKGVVAAFEALAIQLLGKEEQRRLRRLKRHRLCNSRRSHVRQKIDP
jgi:hypothetical protein